MNRIEPISRSELVDGRRMAILVFVFLGVQLVFDVAGWFEPMLSVAGGYFWLLSCLTLCAAAVLSLRAVGSSWKRPDARVYWGILIVCSAFPFFFLTRPFSASHETAHEIACGVQSLLEPDFGMYEGCFLGYPARGYILPALPSLILGRSQLSLNLGATLLYTIGLLFFTGGVFAWARSREPDRIPVVLACGALALTFIFNCYYFVHFLLMYEQSIFPACLGLAGVGAAIQFSAMGSRLALASLVLVSLHLCFTYTTGVALAALALVYLAYSAWNGRERVMCGLGMLYILSGLGVSLLFREDLKIGGDGSEKAEHFNWLLDGLLFFLRGNDEFAFATVPLRVLTVVLLAYLFSGRLRREGVVIGSWILGVLAASVLSKGFSYYEISFRIHRALVIVPVLMGVMVWIGGRASSLTFRRVLALTGVFIASSCWLVYDYLEPKTRFEYRVHLDTEEFARHLAFIKHMQDRLGLTHKTRGTLVVDDKLKHYFLSIGDQMKYYMPHIDHKSASSRCLNQSVTRTGVVVLLARSNSYCEFWGRRNALIPAEKFVFRDEEYLVFIGQKGR